MIPFITIIITINNEATIINDPRKRVSNFHIVAMMMVTPQGEPRPLPSRNPLPLSSAQEAQVRDLYYKRVRAHCADEIRGTSIPSM